MRCIACHYSLKDLTEHRCPECGRAFDPEKPNTFDSDPEVRRALQVQKIRQYWIGVALYCAVPILLSILLSNCDTSDHQRSSSAPPAFTPPRVLDPR